MKRISIIAAILAVGLASSSCVESSSKYKTLLTQKDSLQTENQLLQADYDETLDILNEIENGFQAIRESEGKMLLEIKDTEMPANNKKQQLIAEVKVIKDLLAQNKEKIEQLQRKLRQTDKNLSATIERLQGELNDRILMVETLQGELSKKDLQIGQLAATVDTLHRNMSTLNKQSAEQQSTIATQDSDLHTVWYYLATDKELKDAKVLTGGGLFRSKDVMKKDFNKARFTKADLRETTAIALHSKSAKVYSSHPDDSYTLVAGEDKMLTLQITNPQKFWGVSRYLVVRVKK
jgi:chromosome segregation ATPase